jgi:hypothetical protein
MGNWTKANIGVLMLAIAAVVSLHGQDHHGQATARGEKAMGFDLAKTAHHFYLYEDGGAIQVTVLDRKDKVNLHAVQSHLAHISQMFAAGDFSTPHFVHAQNVPGVEAMTRLKDRITYVYDDLADGGRVRISTRHARALLAIHQFLRFQIEDHKTGDTPHVTRVK